MDPKRVHSSFVVSMYELDQITNMQIEIQGKMTMSNAWF